GDRRRSQTSEPAGRGSATRTPWSAARVQYEPMAARLNIRLPEALGPSVPPRPDARPAEAVCRRLPNDTFACAWRCRRGFGYAGGRMSPAAEVGTSLPTAW